MLIIVSKDKFKEGQERILHSLPKDPLYTCEKRKNNRRK